MLTDHAWESVVNRDIQASGSPEAEKKGPIHEMWLMDSEVNNAKIRSNKKYAEGKTSCFKLQHNHTSCTSSSNCRAKVTGSEKLASPHIPLYQKGP
jgi:hypothetical protein